MTVPAIIGVESDYTRIKPDDIFDPPIVRQHAVFGPLMEANLVERYDIYKRTNINTELQEQQEKSEVLSVNIKVGTRLNAHVGIVHGGIISLLFDTSLGYAPIAYLGERYNRDLVALTANLKVDFRAPFKEGSTAIIRVFFDRMEGKKKLYFSAILEDVDKSIMSMPRRRVCLSWSIPRRWVIENEMRRGRDQTF